MLSAIIFCFQHICIDTVSQALEVCLKKYTEFFIALAPEKHEKILHEGKGGGNHFCGAVI